jgi:hypothetical protein
LKCSPFETGRYELECLYYPNLLREREREREITSPEKTKSHKLGRLQYPLHFMRDREDNRKKEEAKEQQKKKTQARTGVLISPQPSKRKREGERTSPEKRAISTAILCATEKRTERERRIENNNRKRHKRRKRKEQ